MSELPPPRYRVVEDGRRLVVTDNWEVRGRPDAPEPSQEPSLFGQTRRTRFDGGGELTTHPLYDTNGPRTIRFDANSATLVRTARYAALAVVAAIVVAIVLSPWLLLPAAFIAFQSHGKARAAITRWLDTVQREAS